MNEADDRRINLMAIRFLALLIFVGGLMALALAAGIACLPTRAVDGGFAYVIPGGGGRHLIDARVTLIMAAAGGTLLGLGLFGASTARLLARRMPPLVRGEPEAAPLPAAAPRSRRTWLILGGGLMFLLAVIVARRAGLLAP